MNWKRVCASSDVPKDTVKKFAVDGVNVIVVNCGEEFRIFPPLCPHMEESLDETAIIEGQTITCSKHLWQWDLRSGEMKGAAERPVLMYETSVSGDDVMIKVEQEITYDYDEDDDFDEDDFFGSD